MRAPLLVLTLACSSLFLLSLPSVSDAAPITYTDTHAVGTGEVDLSITTDGTIGVILGANIIDWLITVTIGATSFTIEGPLSGNTSQVQIVGTALTATPTDLFFDFSAVSGYALFQAPLIGFGSTFYCAQIISCFDFVGPGEAVSPFQNFEFERNSLQGQVSLASADGITTPVPEPATLSLLGLGLAGAAVRRFKKRR